MPPFFSEIRDLWRFCKTKNNAKEIIFYAEHEGYYPTFEGIIEALLEKYEGDICYVTSSFQDKTLQKKHPRIKTFYINKFLPFWMLFLKCKVFVMTLTDLNQFHLKRSTNPVHYVYVFHALVSTHMAYRKGSFDYYDSILCVGPHHVNEIRQYEKMNNQSPKQLVCAGYYRLERIYKKYKEHCGKKMKNTVLIAPSWGEKNLLERHGVEIIGNLLKAGFHVIVRPHPETVKKKPELLHQLSENFSQNPRFQLEKSVAGDASLLDADVLICDLSGITLEYALGTERPVLFVDIPPKIKNSNYGELNIEPLELALRSKIGVILSVSQLKDISSEVDKLISNQEMYKKRLAALREEIVYSFGRSSEIGAEHIVSLCQ